VASSYVGGDITDVVSDILDTLVDWKSDVSD